MRSRGQTRHGRHEGRDACRDERLDLIMFTMAPPFRSRLLCAVRPCGVHHRCSGQPARTRRVCVNTACIGEQQRSILALQPRAARSSVANKYISYISVTLLLLPRASATAKCARQHGQRILSSAS